MAHHIKRESRDMESPFSDSKNLKDANTSFFSLNTGKTPKRSSDKENFIYFLSKSEAGKLQNAKIVNI
jgi:hypothetical protein